MSCTGPRERARTGWLPRGDGERGQKEGARGCKEPRALDSLKDATSCSRALRSPVGQDLARAVLLRSTGHPELAGAVCVHRVDVTIPGKGYLAAVGRPDGIFPILNDQLSIRAVGFYREDAQTLGAGILVEDYPVAVGRPVRRVLLPPNSLLSAQ